VLLGALGACVRTEGAESVAERTRVIEAVTDAAGRMSREAGVETGSSADT
jgi:hypothetical protein